MKRLASGKVWKTITHGHASRALVAPRKIVAKPDDHPRTGGKDNTGGDEDTGIDGAMSPSARSCKTDHEAH